MAEIIIGILLLISGFGTGWVISDINDRTRPPKIQEVTTIINNDMTARNEMVNNQIQQTTIYNGLSNQFTFVTTNQTGYTNYQKSLITNKTIILTTTNYIQTNK